MGVAAPCLLTSWVVGEAAAAALLHRRRLCRVAVAVAVGRAACHWPLSSAMAAAVTVVAPASGKLWEAEVGVGVRVGWALGWGWPPGWSPLPPPVCLRTRPPAAGYGTPQP